MSKERLEKNMDCNQTLVVLRTVYNGNLKILNVPHTKFDNSIGPDGEEEYLTGDVMYKLSKMFRYMLENKITTMDYSCY